MADLGFARQPELEDDQKDQSRPSSTLKRWQGQAARFEAIAFPVPNRSSSM